jgi:hypothetical protein
LEVEGDAMWNTITKSYTDHSFVLNKLKLSRLCEVIEERCRRYPEKGYCEKEFTVTINEQKEAKVGSLEEVLRFDNGPKNPITEIEISYRLFKDKERKERVLAVIVDYDGSKQRIAVAVGGEDLDGIRQLISELEEQVERAFLHGLENWLGSHKDGTAAAIVLIAAVLVFSVLVLPLIQKSESRKLSLSDEARSELLEKATKAKTAEEKIDVIYAFVKSTSSKEQPSFDIESALRNWRTYCILLPAMIIAASIIYLFLSCYPRYVFEWGDAEDQYKKIIERRKTVSTVIIGAFVVGALASLFVAGITTLGSS